MYQDYSYVFVVTYGRSGSTLLMKLLNQIPGYELRGENFNTLFHLMQSVDAAAETKIHKGRHPRDADNPWFGASAVNDRDFARSCLDAFVRDVLAPSPKAKVIGFKEIRHTPDHVSDQDFARYIELLTRFFPNARIVFNTRKAESLRNSGWYRKMTEDEVHALINASDARFRQAAESNPACFMIDYDDLCEGGDAVAALYAFLGAPFEKSKIRQVLDRPLLHMKRDQKWRRLKMRFKF